MVHPTDMWIRLSDGSMQHSPINPPRSFKNAVTDFFKAVAQRLSLHRKLSGWGVQKAETNERGFPEHWEQHTRPDGAADAILSDHKKGEG